MGPSRPGGPLDPAPLDVRVRYRHRDLLDAVSALRGGEIMDETQPSHGNAPTMTQTWRFTAYQTAPASRQMEKDFLTIAGSLAIQSAHPAAPAIDRVAQTNGHTHCPVIGF